jgi:hemerythrin-like metal-binding protein
MPIVWRDSLSINEPHIDHQHKSIINTRNVLERARHEKDAAAIFKVFQVLLPYFKKHFLEEEKYYEAIKYPRRDWHKQVHAQLVEQAEEIYRTFARATDDDGRLAAAGALQQFLEDYIFGHIVKEDLKVKPYTKLDTTSPVSMIVLAEQSQQAYEERVQARTKDLEYHLPAHLAHLLNRIEFVVPVLPPPQKDFTSFQALCESAIFRRLDRVLLFFHRYNPELRRELPPLFLSSQPFREKFQAALKKLVLPLLWESRQVRLAASSLDLTTLDDESFWFNIGHTLRADIMQWWRASWMEMRPVVAKREADGRTVLKVKENLKQLREMLQPDYPEQYDLPKIGQRELDLFASLLDVDTDWWDKLNLAWTIFVDLYEQEKDPRVFQQKARDGALRDFMLESFNKFPTEWLDFLLLCCHATFPRVTTMFLDSFTRNYEHRDMVLPFTMRYLEMVAERKDIRQREIEAEALYVKQREELRGYLTKNSR